MVVGSSGHFLSTWGSFPMATQNSLPISMWVGRLPFWRSRLNQAACITNAGCLQIRHQHHFSADGLRELAKLFQKNSIRAAVLDIGEDLFPKSGVIRAIRKKTGIENSPVRHW